MIERNAIIGCHQNDMKLVQNTEDGLTAVGAKNNASHTKVCNKYTFYSTVGYCRLSEELVHG